MKQAVGVIGGVGPMATVYYMQRVIEMTKAGCDQEHINMLVFNDCDIPDRTAFITEKSPDNPLPVMVEDAKRLEAAGCEFVVIPCNTAHYFYDELEQAVEIPVVNIVEETIRYAKARVQDLSCVGIMATTGTIVTGTYQKYAERAGLSFAVPDEDEPEVLPLDSALSVMPAGGGGAPQDARDSVQSSAAKSTDSLRFISDTSFTLWGYEMRGMKIFSSCFAV